MTCRNNRKEKITKHVTHIPRVYVNNYLKATRGKSLKAAVQAMCLECTGYQKLEVRDCTALACPLYAVRPYQTPRQRHTVPNESKEVTKQSA